MSFAKQSTAKRTEQRLPCFRYFWATAFKVRRSVVVLFLAAVVMTTAQGQETGDSRDKLLPLLKLGFAENGADSRENPESVDDKRSTDELLELDDEDASSGDASDEQDDAFRRATSKQQAIDAALSRLRKPLHQIRVAASEQDPNSPANEAAAMGDHSAPELISDSGSPIQRYRRRTVCFSHLPLYFQQSNLERCGNGYGCATSAVSGMHFFASAFTLPYHAAQQHPGCPVHADGDCRCGQSFPLDLDPLPIDLKATAAQLATMAGFSFLLL